MKQSQLLVEELSIKSHQVRLALIKISKTLVMSVAGLFFLTSHAQQCEPVETTPIGAKSTGGVIQPGKYGSMPFSVEMDGRHGKW